MKLLTKQEEGQIRVFGLTEAQLLNEISHYLGRYPNGFLTNLDYAMSVMSDAQEEMVRGNNETARKFINKAKFALSLHNKKY